MGQPHLHLILWTLLLFCIGGCGTTAQVPVEKQGFYMGTVIAAKVYGADGEKATTLAMERIKALEDKMTINVPNSEIQRLNNAAGSGNYVSLSADTIDVLQAALAYGQLSSGALDITVGPLVQDWGHFGADATVPAPDVIARALPLVDYKDVEINFAARQARLKKPGQVVDLGSIAKGYAGDEVIKIFQSHGIKSAYINLGGNVVVLGGKPDGSPWRVGIRNPRAEDGGFIGTVQVKDMAVVTSGDYERYFTRDGVRYHHVLDPYTGHPARSGLISVTIVTPQSIVADALSTAVFVLGLDKGMTLVQSLEGVEAIFITQDRQIHITPGLQNNFILTDIEGAYQYHEKI